MQSKSVERVRNRNVRHDINSNHIVETGLWHWEALASRTTNWNEGSIARSVPNPAGLGGACV